MRVLIVEDNLELANDLSELLKLHGQNAVVADSIHAARGWLSATQQDVILLDLLLKEDAGEEILRFLDNSAIPHVPVVVLTGAQEERVAILQKQHPDLIILRKPVKPDVLLEALITVSAKSKEGSS